MRISDWSSDVCSSDLQCLAEEGIAAMVSGRMKTPYSVWRKMQRKNITFEQLSDIMAFRVVVGSLGDCYHALGLLNSRYHVVPGRFQDSLPTHKQNGRSSCRERVCQYV